MSDDLTPSQTIGPFFSVMRPLASSQLVAPGSAGALTIAGRVFDGVGEVVTDALLELWQADGEGRYAHPADPRYPGAPSQGGFTGFGRCHTGPDGRFSFVTLKPGPVPGFDERTQAPHISVSLFARGLLRRLATRIYFPDEARANAMDPLLASISELALRATLIAEPAGPSRLRFDIRLQGDKETAFLAI
ncbi:MAG: protocatechuate 3,4-dioxygenase subunit alpha [Tepidiformaceae bacterium]